jgi:hypothetical protein
MHVEGITDIGRREAGEGGPNVTDLEWETARTRHENGRAGRGYRRPVTPRIWEGALPYRAGLNRGRGFRR